MRATLSFYFLFLAGSLGIWSTYLFAIQYLSAPYALALAAITSGLVGGILKIKPNKEFIGFVGKKGFR